MQYKPYYSGNRLKFGLITGAIVICIGLLLSLAGCKKSNNVTPAPATAGADTTIRYVSFTCPFANTAVSIQYIIGYDTQKPVTIYSADRQDITLPDIFTFQTNTGKKLTIYNAGPIYGNPYINVTFSKGLNTQGNPDSVTHQWQAEYRYAYYLKGTVY